MTARGKYIVLEGDEGAGKTAQLVRVRDRLEALGHTVEIVREPGGDPFAEELRKLLKHAEYPISPVAETLAFSAARANMIANVVKPHLDRGTWVLSDRSFLSTIIYQGGGRELISKDTKDADDKDFSTVVKYAIKDAFPNLILILDVSFEESRRRQQKRGLSPDRFDSTPEFRLRINKNYKLVKNDEGVLHVDGEGTFKVVEDRIMEAIEQHLHT
ncbi:MAG TPA: dTMP kinase [Candidatus Saccharimonadia bacterium]|nr:dTMP kinase [Candidatus Saccharimonadia bacterium]